MTFKVAIIGGGIGGLTLAHGLRGAGVDVGVYERDQTKTDRLQGYRIHLSPKGCRALHSCLPEPLFARFVETTGRANSTVGFFDQDLRKLLVLGEDNPLPEDYIDSYRSVNRMSLRKVLISQLDGVLQLGRQFSRYEQSVDGRVRAHFADGSHADADLLVAADGAGSRVREQYLPEAARVDTGAFVICGKVEWNQATRGLLPPAAETGPYMVFGPGGKGLFMAAHRCRTQAAAGQPVDLLWDENADYIMWNLVTTWDKVGPRETVSRLSGEQLRDLAAAEIAGWDQSLPELMRRSVPASVMAYPFSKATLLKSWQPGNVTLLGDAIHCMPPTAGQGANTAIRDAAALKEAIVSIAEGRKALPTAIGEYEEQMRGYAYPIVKEAVRNLNGGIRDSRFAHRFTTRVFRTVDAIGPLRRKLSRAMLRER